MFGVYGIDLNDVMLSAIFDKDQLQKFTKGTSKPGGLMSAFSITLEGKPNGILSIFFLRAAGVTNEKDLQEMELEEGIEQATLNNPLWTENTTMKILAKIAANFTPVLFSSTHKSIEGKKIWDFSQNTALSKRIQFLKNDTEKALDQYKKMDLITKTGKDLSGSFYLRNWERSIQRFNLYYLEGLNYGSRGTGVTRQKMSDREQLIFSITAFQNKGRGYGHFVSLTHSDKTMTPLGYGVIKLETGIEVLEKPALDEIKAIFYAEHRRISLHKQSYGDKAYDEGKKYFFFLPQFNRETMMENVGTVIPGTNIRLTEAEIAKLWNADGSIKPNTDAFGQLLDAYLVQFINDLTDNTFKTWQQNGITPQLFDKKVLNQYKKAFKELSEDQKNDAILKAEARKYALNHFIWNVNLSMLFYGDPAQTWKGSVPATMIEYAKRLAKDIAPGQDLAFPKNSTYNTVTLKDVKVSDDYITRLGIASNSNGTDAQELTTVQEHLDVMYAAGLIKKEKYHELTDVIRQGNENYYEFTPQQLDIIMQPMKPVYAGFRSPLNGAMLYDYVKSDHPR